VFRRRYSGEAKPVTVLTPPTLRTHLGQEFTDANRDCALALQHCVDCGCVQYPSRELCQQCLQDELQWQETDTRGVVLNRIALHHSISEYYNHKIKRSPWPIASVKLNCGATVFAHLALHTFSTPDVDSLAAGTAVCVFSHNDCTGNAVLFAVSELTHFKTDAQRQAIMEQMGLHECSQDIQG
jgi:uncharacterized OB-fold protein